MTKQKKDKKKAKGGASLSKANQAFKKIKKKPAIKRWKGKKPVEYEDLIADFDKHSVASITTCPLYREQLASVDSDLMDDIESIAGLPTINFTSDDEPTYQKDPYAGSPEECAQLEGEILKAESELTDSMRKVAPKAANPSFTVSIGKLTKDRKSVVIKARSQKLAAKKWQAKGWAPGTDCHSEESNVPDFEYQQNNAAPYQSHGEARILESIFGPPLYLRELDSNELGEYTLVFRVHWHGTKVPLQFHPCEQCQKALAAAQEAGLKIKFCPGDISHDH